MAIYHFSMQIVSRGKGQSVTAAAAYRSGEKIHSERYGKDNFYVRNVQPDSFILKPDNAPDWVLNRERLWNEVERVEKRKDAQLAREFNVALPKELSYEQQKELIKEYCNDNFVKAGMVSDVSIHRDDKNNPHAHVLLTMRPFKKNGEWGNKTKTQYILDDEGKKTKTEKGNIRQFKVPVNDWNTNERLQIWRHNWSVTTNKYLAHNGIEESISELSLEEQGIDRIATIHEGYVAREIEKKGQNSDKVNQNREIKKDNRIKNKIHDIQRNIDDTKTAKIIKRSFTPEEKKSISFISKGLKTFITYESIEDKKRMLNNWRGSLFTKGILSGEKINLSIVDNQENLIEKADEILENEGKRFISKYYPYVDQSKISTFMIKDLTNFTVSEDRILNKDEVKERLMFSNKHELDHNLSLVLKDPYVTHYTINKRIDWYSNKLDKIVNEYQIDFENPSTIMKLNDETKNDLKTTTMNLNRYKTALNIVNDYYDQKIKLLFPEAEVTNLNTKQKEIVINIMEYYKEKLTKDNIIEVVNGEDKIQKYNNESQIKGIKYLINEQSLYSARSQHNAEDAQTLRSILNKQSKDITKELLNDLRSPSLRNLFIAECGDTRDEKLKGLIDEYNKLLDSNSKAMVNNSFYNENTFRRQTGMNQMMKFAFGLQSINHLLSNVDYHEREKVNEDRKAHNKAVYMRNIKKNKRSR